MNQIDVSIIIINYNTFDLLCQCIESIYKLTDNVMFEIIVVDNYSPNREIEELLNIFPNVKLILSSENLGFGYGNNVGVKYASGEYIFFLNSDTILLNNAIYYLQNFMERNPNAGVCGGNLYNLKLEPNISFERFKPGVFIYSFNKIFDFLSRKILNKMVNFEYGDKPKKIKGYICGANFFMRKEVFFKVNGFDENFFMYFEEVDLTLRVNHLGLDSYVLPEAKIIHLEGGSQVAKSKLKIQWMNESQKYYFSKNNIFGLFIVKLEIFLFEKIFNLTKKIKNI